MTVAHIYLSPHLDDAVFSVGGRIRQQCANGERVLVLSVFTESPDSDQLSPFARAMHRVWTDYYDPLAVRRAEDEAAMRALGAEFLHLGYPSAMYRLNAGGQPLYQGVGILGKVHPEDASLIDSLAATFAQLRAAHPQATIYVPLGVGNHVDHQIVNRAARHLPGPVRHYEDFPYVMFGALGPFIVRLLGMMGRLGVRPLDANPDARAYPFWPALLRTFRSAPPLVGGPQFAHEQPGALYWRPELYPIDLSAKIQDALNYASQIRMLFGNERNLQRALEIYTLSLGRTLGMNTPHERLWLAPAPVPVRTQLASRR